MTEDETKTIRVVPSGDLRVDMENEDGRTALTKLTVYSGLLRLASPCGIQCLILKDTLWNLRRDKYP